MAIMFRAPPASLAPVDTEEIVREVAEKVREAVDSARQRAEEIVREAEVDAERIRSEAEADARRRLDQVRRSLTELEAALGPAGESPPAQRESQSTAPKSRGEAEPSTQPQAESKAEPRPGSEPKRRRRPEARRRRRPEARRRPQSEAEPRPEPGPEPQPQPAPATDKASTEELLERLAAVGGPAGETSSGSAAAREPSAGVPNRAGSGSEAAARLVAMKLALDGTPRDETRKRVAADYDVADLDSLLDEVYARAGR